MVAPLHRRRHARFTPTTSTTLSFCMAGRWFLGVPITDLSVGGCRALMPRDLPRHAARLDHLEIHHPLVPPTTFKGLLVRQDARGAAGIAFRDLPKDVRQLLQGLTWTSVETRS